MLKKLKLTNFRNHKSLEIELKKTTVILGPNGVGKSNILEAVSLLSFCRSYREENKNNLIAWEQDYTRVVADEYELAISVKPKKQFILKYRGVSYKKSDFIGLFLAVVFSPETLNIITSGPKERRRFLDIMISQTDHAYLRALIEYEKVRKQRNGLLEMIRQGRSDESELTFWDTELTKYGQVIVEIRKKAEGEINKKISVLYQEISGGDEEVRVNYKTNVGSDFTGSLVRNRRLEIAVGHTMFGPHRDDLLFLLDNKEASNFASRGELRSVVLALKFFELDFLTEHTSVLKKNSEIAGPLLLLDDVFSEFDQKRRSHLFKLIEKYQTIITTTDKEYLSEAVLENCEIINL